MRRTKEEVERLKAFALKHGKTERWARSERAKDSELWRSFVGTAVVVEESAPLEGLEGARAELASLERLLHLDIKKAEYLAKQGGEGDVASVRRVIKETAALRDKVALRVRNLELEAGQLVSGDEVAGYSAGLTRFAGALRDSRGVLARAAVAGDVGSFYKLFDEWVERTWNPQCDDAGGFYESLKVRRCGNVREWVEKNVFLPKAFSPSAPGYMRFDRCAPLVGVLEAAADPSVRTIDLVFAAQNAKTTICAIIAAYWMEWEGGPTIWGVPTDTFAKDFARSRLKKFMFRNETFKSRFRGDKEMEESAGVLLDFGDMFLVSGMDKPGKAASYPMQLIIADEVEKFEQKKKDEARPLLLLEERRKTFVRSLMLRASTPTVEETPFYEGYLQSTQYHYFMPCPECAKEFEFEFSKERVRWAEGADIDEIRATAVYVCPHCECEIENEQKFAMMQAGRWVSMNEGASREHVGFHLNSLYSQFLSFGDVAAAFKRATGYLDGLSDSLRNFYNSWLALPYREVVMKVHDDAILRLRGEHKRGELPANVMGMVVSYDPGHYLTHWSCCVWDENWRLYLVDYGEMAGVKVEDGEGIAQNFALKHFGKMLPDFGFVDSGDETLVVYEECAKLDNLYPTKGKGEMVGMWAKTPLRQYHDKKLFTYSDKHLKDMLYQYVIAKGERYELVLPYDVGDDFIKGISGQQKVKVKGEYVWQKKANDHYGDTLKLNLFGLMIKKNEAHLVELEEEEA